MGSSPFAFSVAMTAPAMSVVRCDDALHVVVRPGPASRRRGPRPRQSVSHPGPNLAGAFLSFLVPEQRVQDVVVSPFLNQVAFASVGIAPELRDDARRLCRLVLLLHGSDDAEGLLLSDVVPVEGDVDRAGATDDLPVVVDRLAANGGEQFPSGW